MIKLLYLIPRLDYNGAARKVTLLAAGLPRDRFDVRVCVLGTNAPWVGALRQGGVAVDVLGWTRPLDVRPLLTLRRLLQGFQPHLIHAWSRQSLHTLAVTPVGNRCRLFASDVLKPGERLTWWQRLVLRNVERVLVFSAAEAEHLHCNRVPARTVATVPLGIPLETAPSVAAPELSRLPKGRFILGIGPLEMHKGFRDAVWALDILHYLYGDLHLVLAGKGRDQARVAQFIRAVGATAQVHFFGPVADLAPLLDRAVAVWVPSLSHGGGCAALAAMAAGRPVVATRVAGLDEIVVDSVTGYLVRPGDKAGLARQTRLLLDNPELAARLGEAGRRRVAEHFPVARMVQACERLYAGALPADLPGNPP